MLLIIAEESNRLIGLVNSVLDLAKLESGLLAFNFGKADLSPLIARVVEEVGPLAEAKHIKISREVRDLPPLTMDAERMLQVLRNLIGNALKFTPRGGTVSITARREKDAVIVAVIDTGPGIPKEHATAIFDKFRQVPGAGRHHGNRAGAGDRQAHHSSAWRLGMGRKRSGKRQHFYVTVACLILSIAAGCAPVRTRAPEVRSARSARSPCAGMPGVSSERLT